MLFKRIDDAKRKQSIYSQISLNCYATGGNKHPKPISYLLLLCHVQLTKQKAISCKQHLSLSLILRTTSNYPPQNKYHRYCIVEDNLQVPNDAFEDNFSNIYIYKSLILYEMQLCFPSSPSGAKKH